MEIEYIKKFITDFLEILNTNRKILIKESTNINIDLNNNVLDFKCELIHKSNIIFEIKYKKSFKISISTCFLVGEQITVDKIDDEILHTLTELYNIKCYSTDLICILNDNNLDEMKKIKRKNNLGALIDMFDIDKKVDDIITYDDNCSFN